MHIASLLDFLLPGTFNDSGCPRVNGSMIFFREVDFFLFLFQVKTANGTELPVRFGGTRYLPIIKKFVNPGI
jgi:hypothetical protein